MLKRKDQIDGVLAQVSGNDEMFLIRILMESYLLRFVAFAVSCSHRHLYPLHVPLRPPLLESVHEIGKAVRPWAELRRGHLLFLRQAVALAFDVEVGGCAACGQTDKQRVSKMRSFWGAEGDGRER